ncbi:uncharacterized protein V6R79_001511 [Siganus canaliculatus]
MASETTMPTSCAEETQDAAEYRENIPPGVSVDAGTSKLPHAYTFSTPAPTNGISGVKAKSRLSGLQSALTPILKHLNIDNKRGSPEHSKQGNSVVVPSFSFDNVVVDGQKSSQHATLNASRSCLGPSSDGAHAAACWLPDEYLPEITLLDVTCDTTAQMTKNDSFLPDSVPSTPAARPVGTFTTAKPSQLISSTNLNMTAELSCPQKKTPDQSNANGPKAASEVADRTTEILKNTTEASVVLNPGISVGETNGPHDVESSQKSSDAITSSSTHPSVATDKSSLPKNGKAKNTHSQVNPSKFKGTAACEDTNTKMTAFPESIDAPLRWLDDRYFPEITLLDVTHDSEFSPGGELRSLEVTQNISLVESLQNPKPSSPVSGQTEAEAGTLDTVRSEDLSRTLDGNGTHTMSSISDQSEKSASKSKDSLEATRDISMSSAMDNTQPSLEHSRKNTTQTVPSEEDAPANITHDISSSSDMSTQCSASLTSAADVQCNTSSKNVTSEIHDEPVVPSTALEGNSEDVSASHDADLKSKQESSLKAAASANDTYTIAEQSNLSASTNGGAVAQTPCPQNKTLDLAPSNVNSPRREESDTKDQAASVLESTTGTLQVVSQNCSTDQTSGSCDVQNVTFDRHSLQKSRGSITSGEAGAGTFCLQNNTFDSKSPSKQNGTITVSETSSNDSHQNTLDKATPSEVCNATSSPKEKNSGVQLPDISKSSGATVSGDSCTKSAGTPEGTFEANPAAEATFGGVQQDIKDHSQPKPDLAEGLSDNLGHQSVDVEDSKANTLNLDDTLDLKVDFLVTSTPMPNSKMLNFDVEREEGKTMAAQKKLYGDGPSKPSAQVPSEVPSNIICDRKTFLTQPTARSLLPPLKAGSQLLKYKSASAHPGKFEPMASGLPMTRQRTQAEAMRKTTGTSATYNLRPITAGSKQPSLGLRKPQLSALPTSIQRAAPGLRPPSARSNAPASLSSDKLSAPSASHAATKISQPKKHPLTRGEALPTAKRKKMDIPASSGTVDASATCDAATKAKNLKQPTALQKALPAKAHRDDAVVPASSAETSTSCNAASRVRGLRQPVNSHRTLPKAQGLGCSKCIMLEQQLEIKSEEIKKLKEELQKYRNPKEDN